MQIPLRRVPKLAGEVSQVHLASPQNNKRPSINAIQRNKETLVLPAEFSLIARHFAPLAGEGGLGLTDDAAIITPPAGRELVVTADAMVAGVHFLPDEKPENIARKLLRVNLSDIAAMGATPLYYLLTLSAPRGLPDEWFAGFAHGLALDQARYNVALLGGDTTSTPGPITLSVTMFGHVAPGTALRRSGARAGDNLYVTGIIGDGVLGLMALRGEIADPDGTLAAHYRLPEPRLGLDLHGIATAAMDISDGLIQDAGHMARASGVALEIEISRIPLSPAGRAAGPDFVASGTAGGDDYELVLAAAPESEAALQTSAEAAGIPITRIGQCIAGEPGVRGIDAQGREIPLGGKGWSHF
jgi:thiamine-monophosphate kinase